MRESLQQYCDENNRPDLLRQWDNEANLPLTPESVTSGSSQKIWWVCEKGHRWQAATWERTLHCSGCPVCCGKKIIPGLNDLKTADPELADEWDSEKNGSLQPDEFSPNSHQKVWWKCRTCGYEWQAAVFSRTGGSGCPVCAGKKIVPGINDLASHYPELAAQWHPTKNGALTPEDITPQSNRSAWWICEKGHEYKAMIQSRTVGGSGCPYCTNKKVLPGFNDLASQLPRIAAEWHPTKNGTLTPQDVTCGSAKKVWWQCSGCGYEWKAVVFSRAGSQRCGCPACAGKVKTTVLYYDLTAAPSSARAR